MYELYQSDEPAIQLFFLFFFITIVIPFVGTFPAAVAFDCLYQQFRWSCRPLYQVYSRR